MVQRYKNENLFGRTITFTRKNGRVWAKIPSITSQYIAEGETKYEAMIGVLRFFKEHKQFRKTV